MQQQEILDALNAAEDKDQLAVLAKDLFGADIDKRKGLDTLREQLLSMAAEHAEDEEPGNDDAQAGKPVKPRMLLNTENGRSFVYTDALAKLPHMVEE